MGLTWIAWWIDMKLLELSCNRHIAPVCHPRRLQRNTLNPNVHTTCHLCLSHVGFYSNEELGNSPIKVDPISSFMDTSMDGQNLMEGTFASRWNWYHVRHWNCLSMASKTCWNVTTSNLELLMERLIGSKVFTNVGIIYRWIYDTIINIKVPTRGYQRTRPWVSKNMHVGIKLWYQ